MTFSEFQEAAKKSRVTDACERIEYLALGLGGETGELLEKVKKLWRDRDFEIDDEYRELMTKEMGDVLWYLAHMARVLGVKFDDVAQMNLDKSASRFDRGVVHGDGDTR